MGKWFDANGVDVDAYPDRAFQGGVYSGGILGRTKSKSDESNRPIKTVEVNDDKANSPQGKDDKSPRV